MQYKVVAQNMFFGIQLGGEEVGESTMGGRRECYRRIQRGLRKKGEVEGGRKPHNKGGNVFMGKEGCRSYTIQERDTGGRW